MIVRKEYTDDGVKMTVVTGQLCVGFQINDGQVMLLDAEPAKRLRDQLNQMLGES